jgi:uncharacterized protein
MQYWISSQKWMCRSWFTCAAHFVFYSAFWMGHVLRAVSWSGALLLGCFAVVLRAETPTKDYQMQMFVKIPLRDGVRLNATLYRPLPDHGPVPVIFMLSPYPDDNEHPTAAYFAAHGYIYAYVHVRGRGDSEGSFDPMAQEAQDGYDVVEWFAKQPWCNGKVAMFGGSYAGGDQWLTAMMRPTHLATIVPVASARYGVDFPQQQNIFYSYDLQWLSFTSGKTLYTEVFNDATLWESVFRRLYLDKAAFSKLDVYSGNTTATAFHRWLQHPDIDDYWRAVGGTKKQIAGISIPVLEITGTNDDDQLGALSYHADLGSRLTGSTGPDFLVIGPWDHPGTREPKQDFGGEHHGSASVVDVLRLQREWYDYTMKGGPKPRFLEKQVAYYVSGSNAECWKYADSLDAVSSGSKTFYLNTYDGPNGIYQSGILQPSQEGASGGQWISDPNDLSNATTNPAQPGAAIHGDGLIFHSTPFQEETELNGKINLRLWLSIDAPDTDLEASLFLVTPDGKSHSLTQTVLRARYRNSLEHPEAIHENQPEEYRFAPGLWFAMRAAKGSQLRLIVESLNDPAYEKNWNSMKPEAEQTGADARVAHIRLLQDPQHPSTLTVPLGDVKTACKASLD